MPTGPEGGPVVALPERIDRRLRLGPFPSALDAVKFLCYAAAGAATAQFAGLAVGLAVVGAGFLAAVWRPDGHSWDERVLAFLGWKWRTVAGGIFLSAVPSNRRVRSGTLRLAPSDYVAVVRTGGVPIAYLPPAELARRFELFRELLRATDGRVAFLATLGSIRTAPFLPSFPGSRGGDRDARAGYSELIALRCRRRFRRRVHFVVGLGSTGADALVRLETEVAGLVDRLTTLGLRPERLRDRGLVEAARQIGWSVGEGNG